MLSKQDLNKPMDIIVHCSDSKWGSASEICKWHLAQGWDTIGYHYVITNGYTEYKANYTAGLDGTVQVGRQVMYVGAHDYPNRQKIGICLIGVDKFTGEQFQALANLIKILQTNHFIKDIKGHYENNTKKTCPNFNMEWFKRRYLCH